MTTWHLELEFATNLDATSEEGIDTLASFHHGIPSKHFSIVTHRADTNRATLHLSLDAPTLAEASSHALVILQEATERAFGRSIDPLRVLGLPLAEHVNIPITELAGAAEVAAILGVSRQRIVQLSHSHPEFPAPLAKLRSGPVYDAAAIRTFDWCWIRTTGRPRKHVG